MPLEPRLFAHGHVIFREGDRPDLAYVILSGVVELSTHSDDGPIRIAEIKAGAMFGEMGLIDDQPRSATAIAVGPTRLQPINRDEFLQSLRDNPVQSMPVINLLVQRLRDTNSLLQRRQFHPEMLEFSRFSRGERLWRGLTRPFRRARAPDIATEFKPPWVEIEERSTPLAAVGTLWALLAAVSVATGWAAFAHLDRVVVAPGRVVTQVPEILLQPLETGVLREIKVRAGQRVSKGETLAVMDATFAQADRVALHSQLVSLNAQIVRLETELSGATPAQYSPDPVQDAVQRTQAANRRAEADAQLLAMEAESSTLEAQRDTAQVQSQSLAEQMRNLEELVGMRTSLLDRGSGSRVQMLETRNQLLQLKRDYELNLRQPKEIGFKLAQLAAKREAYLKERSAHVAEELVQHRRERDQVAEQLRKSELRSALVQFQAPSEAVVLRLGEKATVGAVLREAETLMTLVPLDVAMELEVDIDPHDIGHIRRGDTVRIKFDALPFTHYGTIDGKLLVISENTLEGGTRDRPRTIYRGLVALPESGVSKLHDLPEDFRLIPGMAVTAEVKIGDRSLLAYILAPIFRSLDEGLREP